MFSIFPRFSPSLKHGPRSPTCGPPAQEWLETRTMESRHVCNFLTIFTRLEPTVIGGELWFACEGTAVSTGGRAHSSLSFFFTCAEDVVDVQTRWAHQGNLSSESKEQGSAAQSSARRLGAPLRL